MTPFSLSFLTISLKRFYKSSHLFKKIEFSLSDVINIENIEKKYFGLTILKGNIDNILPKISKHFPIVKHLNLNNLFNKKISKEENNKRN